MNGARKSRCLTVSPLTLIAECVLFVGWLGLGSCFFDAFVDSVFHKSGRNSACRYKLLQGPSVNRQNPYGDRVEKKVLFFFVVVVFMPADGNSVKFADTSR